MGQLKEELVLNTNQFDTSVNSVIKKVEELKNKGNKVGDGFNSSMGKMIEKATGFNGSIGSLIGTVGKFGSTLGVAMSAGELFNRMMDQSQTLGDAVAKVQNQASEAVNYFASSLASADFNGFLNGLRNIISLAGDAADAMDRAASIGLRFGWTNQSKLGNYNRAMAEARNPENTKEQRLKYLEEAKQISQQIAKSENIKSQADIKAAFKTIRTELSKIKYNGKYVNANKLSDKDIRELFDVANFERFEKIHDEMKAALDGVVLTNTKYGAHGAHLAKADKEKFAKSNKMLAAYAANEIDDDADSPLGKAVQMIGAVDAMLANQAEREAQTGKLASKIENSTKKITNYTKNGGGSKASKTNYTVGSVGYYEKLIADLQKQMKLQVDSSEIVRLQDEIKKAKNELDNLLNPKREIKIDTSNLGSLIKYKDNSNLQSEAKNLNVQTPNIFEQYNGLTSQLDSVLNAYDMGAIGAEKAQELIDSINSQIATLGLKPIKVHLETDTEKFLSSLETGADSLLSSFNGIDGVISDITSLSQAISEGANGWEVFMGVLQTGVGIIQTVSTVLNTLNTLQELFGTTSLVAAEQNAAAGASEMATAAGVTAAKSGEAIAGATASGAKMPFPLNLIAIAAGVAAVVAALATITGAFANGGVVGGSQYAGDALLARVNSGEMILNGSQQKNLFDLLDKGASGNVSSGNVNFVIRGKDLHGVLVNYDDKMKKVR